MSNLKHRQRYSEKFLSTSTFVFVYIYAVECCSTYATPLGGDGVFTDFFEMQRKNLITEEFLFYIIKIYSQLCQVLRQL